MRWILFLALSCAALSCTEEEAKDVGARDAGDAEVEPSDASADASIVDGTSPDGTSSDGSSFDGGTLDADLEVDAASHTTLVDLRLEDRVGVGRQRWPISGGVGFAKGTVSDPQQLGISNRATQVRVLSRWHEGSIRFALFDWQDSIPAQDQTTATVVRYDEARSPPTGNIVQETASAITVDTGKIRLTVPKTAFAYLGEVALDRDDNGSYEQSEILSSGGEQFYDHQSQPPARPAFHYRARRLDYNWSNAAYEEVEGHALSTDSVTDRGTPVITEGPLWMRPAGGGQETRVQADHDYAVVLREQGPLRTVLELSGTFGADTERCRYFIWIHLFHQQRFIRVQHTFEVRGNPNALNIRRLALTLPLNYSSPPQFRAPGLATPINLAAGQQAHHWREGPADVSNLYHRGFPLPFSSGVEGSNPVRGTNASAGWIDVRSNQWGVTVAMQDMAYKYPKELSYDVDTGLLSAWIWPDHGDKVMDLRASYHERGMEGVSFTTDLFYRFHAADSDNPSDWAKAMDDPPQPTAPPSWYAYYNTKAAGMLMPFEPTRFPKTEAFLAARTAALYRSRIEFGMLGMLNYGDFFWGYRAWNVPNNGAWDGATLGTWGFHSRRDDYDGWRRGNSMISTRMYAQYLRTGFTPYLRAANAHLVFVRDALVKHTNSLRANGIGIGRRHANYFGATSSDRAGGVANEGYGSNWLGHYLHWNLTGDWRTLQSLNDIRVAWVDNPWDTPQVRGSAFIGLKLLGTIAGQEDAWMLADARLADAGTLSSDSTAHWRDCAWFFGYPLYLADVGHADQGAALRKRLTALGGNAAPDGDLNWQRDALAAIYWAAEGNETLQETIYQNLLANGSTETFLGGHTNSLEMAAMMGYFADLGLSGLWTVGFDETIPGQQYPFLPAVLTVDWRGKDDLIQIQWDEAFSMAAIFDYECRHQITTQGCP